MSKPNKNKNRKNKLSKRRVRRKNYWFQIIIFLSIIIAIILLSIRPNLKNESKNRVNRRSEIKFKKEGELTFYKKDSDQKILTIDIEIAHDDYERALGLMHRYKMSESVGMLFIMEREEPQSFWMRNTYISLDIIYLNKEYEIVKIQKYTQPLTDDPIPSINNSKYVVEVKAGFCDLNMIKEGDYIKY